MATKSMAYDHPAYVVVGVGLPGGEIAAAVSSKTARFVAPTAMNLKSLTASVITAGGTINAVQVVKQATGGTALTTLALITNIIGTSVGGFTTNVLMTGAGTSLVQGDIVWVEKGSADGVGVYATGVECVLVPGATVTA